MEFVFPKDFLWGTACSAMQIEGAAFEDGKTANIHDYYTRVDGHEWKKNPPPDVCADFYHRYRDDMKLLGEMGLRSFRFSISWARIYPNGPDEVNPKGIAYYSDLIDSMLENGITPFFDLFHCDPPMWLMDRGGFLNRDFIDWFVKYARTCFEAFGDRVKLWSTVNEPSINIFYAHAAGNPAPFMKDLRAAMQAVQNMLVAHFRTVKLYHSMNLGGKIGAVNHFVPFYGETPSPEDTAAADRARDYYSGMWLDPMMTGRYPDTFFKYPFISEKLPEGCAEELASEFERMDFIGINYYSPGFARYKKNDELDYEQFTNDSLRRDSYGFYTYPEGLFDSAAFLHDTYGDVDIYITENGTATKRDPGNPQVPSFISDPFRIDYMREHMRSISRALRAGLPIRGYYTWAVMDTFEGFDGGLNLDFGLLGIDYRDLSRHPRDSYYFYQKVIRENRVN